MSFFLLENERVDDVLLSLKDGVKSGIIQNSDYFCFGIDAVLLAGFAKIKPNAVVLDLCTGSGIIPIILAVKTKAKHIIGVEIQTNMADMARRSVSMNGLDAKIEIINEDIKNYTGKNFNTVICNPPYKEITGGLVSPNERQAIARTEVCCTLSDVINAARDALCPHGSFFMIHRPERITDILCNMRGAGIEPKIIRFVHSATYKSPSLVLIEGIKGANPKAIIQKPLVIYNQDGSYTDEINMMYN